MNTPRGLSATLFGRPFATLWAAREIDALGYWILLVGLLAWSYTAREWESSAILSLMLLGLMLPPFLLRPVAQWLVDQRDGRIVALLAQLLRAAVLLPLLVAFSGTEAHLVFAAAWLSAVPSAFTQAAIRTLFPTAVPTDRERRGERVLSSTGLLSLIPGSALVGTATTSVYALQTVAAATITTSLLSAALLLLAKPHPGSSAIRGSHPNLLRVLANLQRDTMRTFRDPRLKPSAILQVVVAAVVGGLLVAQVGFVVWDLSVGPERIGQLLAAQGVGILIGSVVRGIRGPQPPTNSIVSVGLAAMAAGSFGLVLSETITWASAFTALFGLGGAFLATGLPAFPIEPMWIGSGGSSQGAGFAVEAMVLLSVIVVGPLADRITPRLTLLAATVLLAALGLYAYGAIPNPAGRLEESPG